MTHMPIVKGCVVRMKSSSGLVGYGNAQCVSSVIEPLGEISLYGHNQCYKDYDVEKVLEYPHEQLQAQLTAAQAERDCYKAASETAVDDHAKAIADNAKLREELAAEKNDYAAAIHSRDIFLGDVEFYSFQIHNMREELFNAKEKIASNIGLVEHVSRVKAENVRLRDELVAAKQVLDMDAVMARNKALADLLAAIDEGAWEGIEQAAARLRENGGNNGQA